MLVNRREALKQFVIISAGALVIPSCSQQESRASIILKNFSITGEQEKILAELGETLLPATDTPGAKDISAHLFALKMLDDCFSKEDQQKFLAGLNEFQRSVKTQAGKSFADCAPEQRNSVLTALESKKSDQTQLSFFYSTVKDLVIQAYTTSSFYLTRIAVYELVPARYHGCVPVSSLVKKAS